MFESASRGLEIAALTVPRMVVIATKEKISCRQQFDYAQLLNRVHLSRAHFGVFGQPSKKLGHLTLVK